MAWTDAWTDERVEKLKRDWANGLSAEQCACRLGGTTRNAVIGKLHRLGLAGRGQSRAAKVANARRTKANIRIKARPRPPVLPVEPLPPYEELVIPVAERKTIQTLDDDSCRWPIGDPQEQDFHFCGKTKLPGISYCEFHARHAYQPPQQRRNPRLAGRVVGLANVDNLKFEAVREFQDA